MLQWAFNAAVAVVIPLLVWALNNSVANRREMTDFKMHVAENYLRKDELVPINNKLNEIGNIQSETMKALYELRGEIRANRGA